MKLVLCSEGFHTQNTVQASVELVSKPQDKISVAISMKLMQLKGAANIGCGLTNTIGAGGTFLAYFVASMFLGSMPIVATQYAIMQANKFLRTKPT